MKTQQRLLRLYKKEMLRMALLRYLRLVDEEEASLERLDEIWQHMSPETESNARVWTASLPSFPPEGQILRDDWDLASGNVECQVCGLTYYDHPEDPREAFPLHVTCDGKVWKL